MLLPSLAVWADTSTVAEADIGATDIDDHRASHAALEHHQWQAVFTSSDPAGPIRHPQRSLPLLTIEDVDILSATEFAPFGQDPIRQGCMVRLALGDTSERTPHCSQAGVADTDVVTPLVLKMIEKVADEVDNEILDSQVAAAACRDPSGHS